MPDDTFEIPDIPGADEDLLAPTETRYYECAECAIKPGAPVMCEDCLERRSEFHRTGSTRRPIYRSLDWHTDRITYVRYLRYHRDGLDREACEAPVTDEDLDREFPDRLEPRLRNTRWRHQGIAARVRDALEPEPVVVRNSWGIPSIWGPMQASRILPPTDESPDFRTDAQGQLAVVDPPYNLTADFEHLERQLTSGMGLQPGQLITLTGRQSGRSHFAAQMALQAVQDGFDVRMVRPHGPPIDVNATVTRAAEEGRTVTVGEVLQELRAVAEQLGLPPARNPMVMGIDYASDVAMPDGGATIYTTMEMSPEHFRMAANRHPFRLPREAAVVVASILDEEFQNIDIYAEASQFEEWDALAVRQIFHNLGIDHARAGLEPIPQAVQDAAKVSEPTWWLLAETYARTAVPKPTRPGPATGPSRFDREFQVPEEPVYRNVLPPPRLAAPRVQPSTLAYLNRGRSSNESTRSAWEKLFGEPGEFLLPSRFERINWTDE